MIIQLRVSINSLTSTFSISQKYQVTPIKVRILPEIKMILRWFAFLCLNKKWKFNLASLKSPWSLFQYISFYLWKPAKLIVRNNSVGHSVLELSEDSKPIVMVFRSASQQLAFIKDAKLTLRVENFWIDPPTSADFWPMQPERNPVLFE